MGRESRMSSQDPRRLAANQRSISERIDALTKRISILEGERNQATDAAERLVRCLYLYGGYNVNSRGPIGCIMDALAIIAPDVHDDITKTDATAVYRLRWGDRE